MQPPWSMAMSTITLPGRIRATIRLETTRRRLGGGDKHGPHEKVRVGHAGLEVRRIGHQRHDPAAILGVEGFKLARVQVEHRHPRAHARGHLHRMRAGIAGADDDNVARERPGDFRRAARRDPPCCDWRK